MKLILLIILVSDSDRLYLWVRLSNTEKVGFPYRCVRLWLLLEENI